MGFALAVRCFSSKTGRLPHDISCRRVDWLICSEAKTESGGQCAKPSKDGNRQAVEFLSTVESYSRGGEFRKAQNQISNF